MPPLRRCAASPLLRGGKAPVARPSRFHGALGLGHALRSVTCLPLRRCTPIEGRHFQCGYSFGRRRALGFTLLELMIVVAIMALATASVSLALRDSDSTQLEREALRLSALLEAGRAQSRSSGVPVLWRNTGSGFEFIGAAPSQSAPEGVTGPRNWLSPDTRVQITQPAGAAALVLGPDPLIAAQRVQLMQGEQRLSVGTDGLAPFAVMSQDAGP